MTDTHCYNNHSPYKPRLRDIAHVLFLVRFFPNLCTLLERTETFRILFPVMGKAQSRSRMQS